MPAARDDGGEGWGVDLGGPILGVDLLVGAEAVESRARKLHKRLHTHRTFDDEQVDLNEKA